MIIYVGLDIMEFAYLEDLCLQRDGSKDQEIGIYLSNNPSEKKKSVFERTLLIFFYFEGFTYLLLKFSNLLNENLPLDNRICGTRRLSLYTWFQLDVGSRMELWGRHGGPVCCHRRNTWRKTTTRSVGAEESRPL